MWQVVADHRTDAEPGGLVSTVRRIAEIPSGSRTRWLVVGFWLVVVVLAGPLSGKLTGAEKNDASAWLPASAESVKVLDVQERFQSPNVYPGVIVYYRASGLTAADRAKAAADAHLFAGLPGAVPGQVAGPIPSSDGKAMQTIVAVNLGTQGWNGAIPVVDAMRGIAGSHANGLTSHVTGPLGTGWHQRNRQFDRRRAGEQVPGGEPTVVPAQFLAVPRHEQQHVVGTGPEYQHSQDGRALLVDGQARVRRQQAGHRFGGDQRHHRRDHWQ